MRPMMEDVWNSVKESIKEKVPAPKEAWQAVMRRAVPKAEEEAPVPTSHEYVPAPTPRAEADPETLRLQVVG